MPSPFPGMDPYLEDPYWMNIHAQLTAEIARQLTPKLRPRYMALMTERFVLDVPDELAIATAETSPDVVSPDVGVVEFDPDAFGGLAVATAVAPLVMATAMPEKIRHYAVEIRDREERELVTAIEVLSPTNKHKSGRTQYLKRRSRMLMSTAHLLEIDLLRVGRRVPMLKPLPLFPYFVFLSRVERRPLTEIWPVRLSDPLPIVPVPLLPGDSDVALDLRQVLTSAYDNCGLDMTVDYSKPPRIPLIPPEAAWAEERLRAAGLRT